MYGSPERPAKQKKGKQITEIQELWSRWVQNFGEPLNWPAPPNLLGNQGEHTDHSLNDTSRTMEEISMATRQIKSGKAAWPDHISAETLRLDRDVTAKMLHVILRMV